MLYFDKFDPVNSNLRCVSSEEEHNIWHTPYIPHFGNA